MGRSLTGGTIGSGTTTVVGGGSGLTVIPSADLDLATMVDVTHDFPQAVYNPTAATVYPLGWSTSLNTSGGVVAPAASYQGAMAGRGDEIFYFGGSGGATQVWKYTISIDRWTKLANSPFSVYNTTCEIIGDIIYLHGNIWLQDLMWAYDTINDSWTQLASNTGNGGYAIQSGVIGTKIIYHGGTGYIQRPGGTKSATTSYRATTWEYDTLLDTWSALPDSPQIRSGGVSGVDGADFWCYGGTTNGSNTTTDVWRFDTLTQFWWKMGGNFSSMIQNTGGMYGGKLYAFAGYSGATKYNWLWNLNLANSAWQNPTANGANGSPQARYGAAFCAVGSDLYWFGGYTSSNVYDANLYRYTVDAVATGATYNIVLGK